MRLMSIEEDNLQIHAHFGKKILPMSLRFTKEFNFNMHF